MDKEKLDRKIAGALFDFASSLTTRKETITVGEQHNAIPILDALQEWAKKRNLNLDEADVQHWND